MLTPVIVLFIYTEKVFFFFPPSIFSNSFVKLNIFFPDLFLKIKSIYRQNQSAGWKKNSSGISLGHSRLRRIKEFLVVLFNGYVTPYEILGRAATAYGPESGSNRRFAAHSVTSGKIR